jgi:hypothetical protein
MAVAGVYDGNTRGEVDVAISLYIPNFRVLCPVGVDLCLHSDAARDGFVFASTDFCVQHGFLPFRIRATRPAFRIL